MRSLRIFALMLGVVLPARADKVIMKDGKIYEGRIMGETMRSLLISNAPIDPKPRFIQLKDVLTVVRESRPEEQPSVEAGRFASLHAGLSGQVFSSPVFSFSPSPGLYVGGGFRVHPVIELVGDFHYLPSMSSPLRVEASPTLTRGYNSFYSYHGGFSLKIFPFFQKRHWRTEPYLLTGYEWSHLVPKGSGDSLSGAAILGGAGVMIPWWRPLYWDMRFVYTHTDYNKIQFLTGNGDLSGVTNNRYSLLVGLSYRFL